MRTKALFLCGILSFAAVTATYGQGTFNENTKVTLSKKTTSVNTKDMNIPDIKIVPKREMTGGQQGADLGLSVLWATSNIDANNAGGYYGRIVAWGELNEKGSYTQSNSEHYGIPRNDISGNVNQDAAARRWGNGWRLPTEKEMKELREKCIWTWSHESGRDGYLVVSKINGNYIFLPAVGINRSNSISEMNKRGYYWTSTPAGNHNSAYRLSFDEKGINILEGSRFEGCYVRAVRSK